jgi:hypothetical protein
MWSVDVLRRFGEHPASTFMVDIEERNREVSAHACYRQNPFLASYANPIQPSVKLCMLRDNNVS